MGVVSRRSLLRSGLIVVGALATQAPQIREAVTDRIPTSRPLEAAILPASTQSGRLGISANSGILWESAASRDQSFAFMQAIGVDTLRIDIPWRWIEPQKGKFQWTLVDPVIRSARDRGMSVLGVLTTTPQWAALGNSTNQQTRPADLAAWAGFAGAVAARYANDIFAYEIWNEPNGVEYFAPAPDPEGYAELVRTALPAIRNGSPNAQVLAGVLGPAPAGVAGMIPALEFFERMLAAGIGEVDAYSFHPYDNDHTMADAAFWDNTAVRQAMRMHELLRARGEGHKKIWASEYGAPSTLGQSRQTELIVSGILQWAECSFTGPMYLHHHRDQSAYDGYGLATQSLHPKEAAFAVQAVTMQAFPERWESTVFGQNRDPQIGPPVSPVYRLADGYAQDHVSGLLFATAHGWLSSPAPVGELLRRAGRLPASPFVNGRQEVAITGGGRVFHSDRGTWLVVGAILSAWTEDLGFPIEDQRVVDANTTSQRFVGGTITWRRYGGTTVARTPPA